MARNILASDPELGQRVVDLQQCLLLESLTPEQLYILARHCKIRIVTEAEAEQPLEDLTDKMVFIANGLFQHIYTKNDKKQTVVLEELKLGHHWGEHFLFQNKANNTNQISLRSKTSGRLIVINAGQFRILLSHWNSVQQTLLETTLQREFKQSLKLGSVQSQLQHTDFVIDRIESVANFLVDQASSDNEEQKQIQYKYLLKEMPNLSGKKLKKSTIEQAYLKASSNREDRIRCKNGDKFTRTTKIGTGATRQVYERDILEFEYDRLMATRKGLKIIKTRSILKEKINNGQITLDLFSGEGDFLNGLVLLEVDFDNESDANNFELPDWLKTVVKEDVTEDKSYSNQRLAKDNK